MLKRHIKLKNHELGLNRTLIMGILNITPDSFSDGGLFFKKDKAVNHALKMQQDGADIIDIGAQSTKPGSEEISVKEELNRIVPVVQKLTRMVDIPISIDTTKPEVAEKCLELGAEIINDINGLRDENMMRTIKKFNAAAVIMHMKGTPKDMQQNPEYKNIIGEIKEFLGNQAKKAEKTGINNIIIDPGIGFGKSVEHNLQILKNLKEFKSFNHPILVGTSRKSFIGKLTGSEVSQRLEGTIASNTIAIMNGANILRVHDVKECKMAAIIADSVKGVRC